MLKLERTTILHNVPLYLKSIIMNASVSVINAVRLGKKGIRHDNTDSSSNSKDTRCRLLKITLGSHDSRNIIMQSKHMLRNQSNPDNVRNLFITPDLTPLEQKKVKL